MSSHRVSSRPPRAAGRSAAIGTDPELIARYLDDAAHFPGGHAAGVALPASEGEVAELVRASHHVLAVGAQSSLTGGATPNGGLVLATSRLDRLDLDAGDVIRVGAGVPLVALQAALRASERFYPPVPTHDGACVGGVTATNAAGPTTFKYGSTRDWVTGVTAVLASGEVLDLRRGDARAHPDGYFEIEESGRRYRVPVPGYRMPEVAKCSAGYFAAPGMDLVDLFVGSEGTLGIVTEVALRVLPRLPVICSFFVTTTSERVGLDLAARLRSASLETRASNSPDGIDVSAIEHMDRRCLELAREDGADRHCQISVPPDSELALWIQLELPAPLTTAEGYDQIGGALSPGQPATPLVRACRMFDELGLLDRMEVAMPEETTRQAQLRRFREAVPTAVNQRVGAAKQTIDPRIQKIAADMVVPFHRMPEMLSAYREGFERRGLDCATWGHLSDGNVHPNVIPRSLADVDAGKAAVLEFGRRVVSLGGCPLAEHGVGRNPVKQALLAQLYGSRGIEAMRRVKRALDPDGKLAPGVLFPATDREARRHDVRRR